MQTPDYMHEEKKAFGLIVSENAWIINVQKCKSEQIKPLLCSLCGDWITFF